ncbi:hypothetical protein KFL_016600010 [Klebsormidium nitens]|uniref:Uncharacterized protein n=1 Tax=Klebsormidium nitens TaxID=105231 RepID=A0A1Y1IVY4_KLENI|nr:hypothetical protein KFL_016600010 [Klebsormidium nitens]|eukprot:GAQ93571.1 hypothetical protein KFL_016600010 [Klebsormidium nitens]
MRCGSKQSALEEGEEVASPNESICNMTKCAATKEGDGAARVQCRVCQASLHVECVKSLMAEHYEGDLYGESYYCDRHFNCVMDVCVPDSQGRGRGAATQHGCQVCKRPLHSLCMRALVGDEFEGEFLFCNLHLPDSLKAKVPTPTLPKGSTRPSDVIATEAGNPSPTRHPPLKIDNSSPRDVSGEGETGPLLNPSECNAASLSAPPPTNSAPPPATNSAPETNPVSTKVATSRNLAALDSLATIACEITARKSLYEPADLGKQLVSGLGGKGLAGLVWKKVVQETEVKSPGGAIEKHSEAEKGVRAKTIEREQTGPTERTGNCEIEPKTGGGRKDRGTVLDSDSSEENPKRASAAKGGRSEENHEESPKAEGDSGSRAEARTGESERDKKKTESKKGRKASGEKKNGNLQATPVV